MARTRSKQYPENQNLILDKAAALFAAQGFHRASIADLARECNYSKASLYHYYASKEAILYAMLDQHMDELDQLAQQAIDAGGAPVEQFRRFVRRAMSLYVTKVHHHTVLNRDQRYLPADLRRRIRERQRVLLQRITTLLKAIRPELAERPGSDKVYALMFFGMLNWTYTWFRDGGALNTQQFADLAVDLFLTGLGGADLSLYPGPVPRAESA